MPEASTTRPSSRAYWACQLLGWGFYGASQLYNVQLNLHVPLGRAAIEFLILTVLVIVFTHLLRDFMRRHGWQRLGMGALLPRILGASLAVGVPIAIVMSFMTVGDLWGAAAGAAAL